MGPLGISEFSLLLYAPVGGLIGLAIGQTRGRPVPGFLLGFLIGPIGWLLVLVGPNPKKAKEEKEKEALTQQQFALQQAQLEELRRPNPLHELLQRYRLPVQERRFTSLRTGKIWDL